MFIAKSFAKKFYKGAMDAMKIFGKIKNKSKIKSFSFIKKKLLKLKKLKIIKM